MGTKRHRHIASLEVLAPAHAGRERYPDRHRAARLLLGPQGDGQVERLLVGEGLTLLGLGPWGFHVLAGVRSYELVRGGRVHDERQRPVELVDAALGCPLRREERVVGAQDLLESEAFKKRLSEELLDLSDLQLVIPERERRVPAGVRALLVPCARVRSDGELLGVLYPAFELGAVRLQRAARIRLGAVDRPLGGPDVAPRLGVSAEVVPDSVHPALGDLFDLVRADDSHGLFSFAFTVWLQLVWKMPERLTFPDESWDDVGSSLHRGDCPERLWKRAPERLLPRVSRKHCEGGIENPRVWESGGIWGERQRGRPEPAEGMKQQNRG